MYNNEKKGFISNRIINSKFWLTANKLLEFQNWKTTDKPVAKKIIEPKRDKTQIDVIGRAKYYYTKI